MGSHPASWPHGCFIKHLQHQIVSTCYYLSEPHWSSYSRPWYHLEQLHLWTNFLMYPSVSYPSSLFSLLLQFFNLTHRNLKDILFPVHQPCLALCPYLSKLAFNHCTLTLKTEPFSSHYISPSLQLYINWSYHFPLLFPHLDCWMLLQKITSLNGLGLSWIRGLQTLLDPQHLLLICSLISVPVIDWPLP